MPWGAVIAAGGSLIGGAMQADAAGDAADSQARSAQASIDEQRRQYDQNRADQMPFMQNGIAGNQALAYLLGIVPPSTGAAANDAIAGNGYGSLLKKFDQNDLNNDVVYNSGLQFGLDQGTGALNQRALQSGSYDSGATLKALTQYANDYGSTKANDAYNRYNTDQTNVYNRLAGISGSGQTATNQVQAAGTNMANQVSNSMTDAGNARSAGIIGGANAWGNAIGGVNNAYNNYSSGQLLQNLLKPTTTQYQPSGGYYQDGNGMG